MLEVDKNDDGYNVVHDELGDDQLVIINTSASSFPLPKMFSFFGQVGTRYIPWKAVIIHVFDFDLFSFIQLPLFVTHDVVTSIYSSHFGILLFQKPFAAQKSKYNPLFPFYWGLFFLIIVDCQSQIESKYDWVGSGKSVPITNIGMVDWLSGEMPNQQRYTGSLTKVLITQQLPTYFQNHPHFTKTIQKINQKQPERATS